MSDTFKPGDRVVWKLCPGLHELHGTVESTLEGAYMVWFDAFDGVRLMRSYQLFPSDTPAPARGPRRQPDSAPVHVTYRRGDRVLWRRNADHILYGVVTDARGDGRTSDSYVYVQFDGFGGSRAMRHSDLQPSSLIDRFLREALA